MIIWHKKMYCDEKIAKHKKRYIKRVEKRKMYEHLYVLALPVANESQLEMYRAGELWFEYNRRKDITVVGLARNQKSAKELVVQMVSDAMKENGKPEILPLFRE